MHARTQQFLSYFLRLDMVMYRAKERNVNLNFEKMKKKKKN